MLCSTCGQVHAPGVTACATTTPPAATPPAPTGAAPDFSAGIAELREAIAQGFANVSAPQRPTVPAAPTATTEVREALPYRFVDNMGQFSLIDDMRAMASGDADARQRLERFMGEVGPSFGLGESGPSFAVTSGNVAALNPVQNRPELFVSNLTYSRPLQEAISTGTLDNKTSFTVPKFASASGLVGTHTEGVEPTPGAFTATSQTVQPVPLSGKIEIVREVWDQGGSPQADTIIWGEMVNAWFEAREARIATLLNGLTLTEINLAGAVDEALVDAVQNILVDLQFVRGGNRYTSAVSDGLLFKALVNASDTGGRKLLPVIGASNAQGTTSGSFDRVLIGPGFRAAWALGASNSSNSYLLVPTSFWQWASAPQRFTFEYQVKSIDMAIWGYVAEASLRDTDAKRIDYTTADV